MQACHGKWFMNGISWNFIVLVWMKYVIWLKSSWSTNGQNSHIQNKKNIIAQHGVCPVKEAEGWSFMVYAYK